MRFKFRYFPAEDRLQFNLATEDMQFACWLTRRQCLTWLSALRGVGCEVLSNEKGKGAAGAKVPLKLAEAPVQQLKNVSFRTGGDRVTAFFKPQEGENIRFSQGKNIGNQIYPKLYSVAMRAGWDPEAGLERMARAGRKPAVSHSLH
jgi:hypothetical protein